MAMSKVGFFLVFTTFAIYTHLQLIYEKTDGGASFGLISLYPVMLKDMDRKNLERIGVVIEK